VTDARTRAIEALIDGAASQLKFVHGDGPEDDRAIQAVCGMLFDAQVKLAVLGRRSPQNDSLEGGSMKFRKKPVVIEAVQFDGALPVTEAPQWLFDAVVSRKVWRAGNVLHIVTLEGTMTASQGDWIIQGVKGELYPCKPDIFEATYEPAGF